MWAQILTYTLVSIDSVYAVKCAIYLCMWCCGWEKWRRLWRTAQMRRVVFSRRRDWWMQLQYMLADANDGILPISYNRNQIAFGIKQQMQLTLQRDTCNNVHLICSKQQGKLLCRYCKAFQYAWMQRQCLLASVMRKLTALPKYVWMYNKEAKEKDTSFWWFEHLNVFSVSSHEESVLLARISFKCCSCNLDLMSKECPRPPKRLPISRQHTWMLLDYSGSPSIASNRKLSYVKMNSSTVSSSCHNLCSNKHG